ncbi:MAG: hypothetical protein B6240_09845 [Desulfobacteraceae bacterium 4572_87]|nr:MAG: hypothetical protein B6240_09845 [Desulfobacteraceae bacterium 4572_87]
MAPKKAIEFFADKIKDPMLLGDFKRVARDNTDVILFNIDSRADASEGHGGIQAKQGGADKRCRCQKGLQPA